ncbi:hypothetical protein BD769DRAFT_1394920 [Suillus cothurnatus]|nr:hypothetical protein BD769DRAFT_1394920 [Suillus cothurnatus]
MSAIAKPMLFGAFIWNAGVISTIFHSFWSFHLIHFYPLSFFLCSISFPLWFCPGVQGCLISNALIFSAFPSVGFQSHQSLRLMFTLVQSLCPSGSVLVCKGASVSLHIQLSSAPFPTGWLPK